MTSPRQRLFPASAQAPAGAVVRDRARERPPPGTSRTAGYFFVALYVGLLLLLGIVPVVYAIYLALSQPGANGGPDFIQTFSDYRFVPAFEHVIQFMAFWLVSQTDPRRRARSDAPQPDVTASARSFDSSSTSPGLSQARRA